MILPTGASSFSEALKMGSETYHVLKKVITKKYGLDGASTSSSQHQRVGRDRRLTCSCQRR